MFSATLVKSLIVRACGHGESEEFSYRGLRDKEQRLRTARCMFCKDCKALVKTWLEAGNVPSDLVELPALVGSDKQVKWAAGIRAVQMKRLLPAMASAAEHGDKIGAAVWQALYAIVTQRQARFWIDNREQGFSDLYIETEAVYFALVVTFGVVFSERSVFGNLKKSAPHILESIRRHCPVGPALSFA